MRASGVLTTPTGCQWGDHLCWGHDGDDASLGTDVAAFLGEGLEKGEQLAFVAPDVRARAAALLGGLGDVEALVGAGTVQLLDLTERYDPEAPAEDQVDGFRRAGEQALRDGYRGLRVAAELTTRAVEGGPAYLRYEHLIDIAMRSNPLTGMCIFDRRALPATWGALGGLHRLTNDPAVPFSLLAAGDDPADGLVLSGEVDALHAAHLARALEAAAVGPGTLRVDATAATFLDHHALAVLDEAGADEVVLRTGFGGAETLAELIGFDRLRIERARTRPGQVD